MTLDKEDNDSTILAKYRSFMQNDVIGEPLGQKDFDAIQGKETYIKILLVDALFNRHCCNWSRYKMVSVTW